MLIVLTVCPLQVRWGPIEEEREERQGMQEPVHEAVREGSAYLPYLRTYSTYLPYRPDPTTVPAYSTYLQGTSLLVPPPPPKKIHPPSLPFAREYNIFEYLKLDSNECRKVCRKSKEVPYIPYLLTVPT